MKGIRAAINTTHWANIALGAGQVLGALPPGIQGNKWVMFAQILLGVVLPSIHGVGHKIAFETDQAPLDK